MPLPAPPNPWRPKRPPRPKKPKGTIKVNIPGYTPNWKQLIESDPRFMGKKTQLMGGLAAKKSTRNANIIRDLIAFGSLPDLTGVDLGDFGLDEATIAQIRANTNPNTSTTARLARNHEANIGALQDMLAARGVLRSGALGVGLSQEQENYSGAQTLAREELLRLLAGYQGDYAKEEDAVNTALYDPFEGYAAQVQDDLEESGLYEPREDATVTATKDPATGLYIDAEGNYYDQDGNPVRNPNRVPGFSPFGAAQRGIRRPGLPTPPRPYRPGYRP